MLSVMKGKDLIAFLQFLNFTIVRTKSSHVRMRSDDGRVTTVPIHGNGDIPKGLLRKIIREDLEMPMDEFLAQYKKFKN